MSHDIKNRLTRLEAIHKASSLEPTVIILIRPQDYRKDAVEDTSPIMAYKDMSGKLYYREANEDDDAFSARIKKQYMDEKGSDVIPVLFVLSENMFQESVD